MPTIRQARVGELIKRDLAEILQKAMRDERVALVTINSVEVARDFTVAKVFVSCMGGEKEKTLAVKALQGAAGFLRGQLGGMLDLRTVPILQFRYDTGVEKGVRMFELLKEEQRFFTDNPQTAEVVAPAGALSPDPSPSEGRGGPETAADDLGRGAGVATGGEVSSTEVETLGALSRSADAASGSPLPPKGEGSGERAPEETTPQ